MASPGRVSIHVPLSPVPASHWGVPFCEDESVGEDDREALDAAPERLPTHGWAGFRAMSAERTNLSPYPRTGQGEGILSFQHNVENVVQVVEGVGVGILVLGGLLALLHSAVLYLIPARRPRAYHYFRKHLGRVILLGLEVLIIADIIRTVIVDQTAESVAVLAAIVVVRIVLSVSLAVEIDGVWPWKKGQTSP